MRMLQINSLEKRRHRRHLEEDLNSFLAMKVPYVQLMYIDDEYISPGSCCSSYRKAIKLYEKKNVECRCINGKVFLINLKLAKKDGVDL